MLAAALVGVRVVAAGEASVAGLDLGKGGGWLEAELGERLAVFAAEAMAFRGFCGGGFPAEDPQRIGHAIGAGGKCVGGKGAGFALPGGSGALRVPDFALAHAFEIVPTGIEGADVIEAEILPARRAGRGQEAAAGTLEGGAVGAGLRAAGVGAGALSGESACLGAWSWLIVQSWSSPVNPPI